MTISGLDLEFSAVTWMVNQNIDLLNEKEKSFIETLFTKYCDYARGSKTAETQVRYLLDVLVGKARLAEPEFPIVPLEKSMYTEQAVFGMAGTDDEDEDSKDEDTDEEETKRKQIKRERQKIQRTELLRKNVRNAPKNATPEQMMSMLTLIAQGQIESRQMANVNLENMAKFAETTEANRMAMEVQLHILQKNNKEMQRTIQELYEMQLQQKSLTDLKWHQLPDWFREIYSGGIKRIGVSLVKLPFRVASITVDRIIYRPMVRAYDFWGGKVELVVGTILWIVVIAGVVHIYQIIDWEMVNNIYKQYGGDYINMYVFSGVDLLKQIPELLPETRAVAISVRKFFFEKCVEPIINMIYMFWQTIIALLTSTANSLISRMPMSNLWFTPAEVSWPNSALFNYAKDFFSEKL